MKLREKARQVKEMISVGKKLRWTPEKITAQIMDELRQKERFQELTSEQQLRATEIVNEECSRKEVWKVSELVSLARKIEKRLKKEFPK